jgi:hypothetical protein
MSKQNLGFTAFAVTLIVTTIVAALAWHTYRPPVEMLDIFTPIYVRDLTFWAHAALDTLLIFLLPLSFALGFSFIIRSTNALLLEAKDAKNSK